MARQRSPGKPPRGAARALDELERLNARRPIERNTQLVLQAMFVESTADAGWEIAVRRRRGEYVDLDGRVALALMRAHRAYGASQAPTSPDFHDFARHVAVCRWAGVWCAAHFARHYASDADRARLARHGTPRAAERADDAARDVD